MSHNGMHFHSFDELCLAVRKQRFESYDHKSQILSFLASGGGAELLHHEVVKNPLQMKDVHQLYEESGAGQYTLKYLRFLSLKGSQFRSVGAMVDSVRSAHVAAMESLQLSRDMLRFHLTGPSCKLFYDSVFVQDEELTELIEVFDGSGAAALFRLLRLDLNIAESVKCPTSFLCYIYALNALKNSFESFEKLAEEVDQVHRSCLFQTEPSQFSDNGKNITPLLVFLAFSGCNLIATSLIAVDLVDLLLRLTNSSRSVAEVLFCFELFELQGKRFHSAAEIESAVIAHFAALQHVKQEIQDFATSSLTVKNFLRTDATALLEFFPPQLYLFYRCNPLIFLQPLRSVSFDNPGALFSAFKLNASAFLEIRSEFPGVFIVADASTELVIPTTRINAMEQLMASTSSVSSVFYHLIKLMEGTSPFGSIAEITAAVKDSHLAFTDRKEEVLHVLTTHSGAIFAGKPPRLTGSDVHLLLSEAKIAPEATTDLLLRLLLFAVEKRQFSGLEELVQALKTTVSGLIQEQAELQKRLCLLVFLLRKHCLQRPFEAGVTPSSWDAICSGQPGCVILGHLIHLNRKSPFKTISLLAEALSSCSTKIPASRKRVAEFFRSPECTLLPHSIPALTDIQLDRLFLYSGQNPHLHNKLKSLQLRGEKYSSYWQLVQKVVLQKDDAMPQKDDTTTIQKSSDVPAQQLATSAVSPSSQGLHHIEKTVQEGSNKQTPTEPQKIEDSDDYSSSYSSDESDTPGVVILKQPTKSAVVDMATPGSAPEVTTSKQPTKPVALETATSESVSGIQGGSNVEELYSSNYSSDTDTEKTSPPAPAVQPNIEKSAEKGYCGSDYDFGDFSD
eukprot:CAMPEP_0175180922 /NCGR_PEP_ID=MMETSP0087-20121206/36358_1 /TAXON_ID=136419 /ORGANISM="Unknown Unknown, Strain D1" /LENGTH=845 /DNA_ID=CAMNT_0016473359 /DNA_START=326 /DNA_END=2865 /DNA_ORIENTATION=+